MITPRDMPPPFATPVNADTGLPLTQRQVAHLAAIKEAGEGLYEAMHNAEGSTMPGEHQAHVFQNRRMIRSAEFVELALMLARKAALE